MRRYVRDLIYAAGVVTAFVVLLPVELVRWALGR